MSTRNKRLKNLDIHTDLREKGYVVIREAIKFPKEKLVCIKKDPRVHSRILWKIRFETKKYFAKYWNTRELVSSFQGHYFNKNHTIDWHVDQNNSHSKGCVSLQGIIALTNSSATEFLTGSHKYFESFARRCTTNNPYEWEGNRIPLNDYIWKKGLIVERPSLKPGDLLLFDSRLIHRVIKHNYRAVLYTSMVPRQFLSNLIERERIKAYKNNAHTTHWCNKVIITDYDDPEQTLKINSLV